MFLSVKLLRIASSAGALHFFFLYSILSHEMDSVIIVMHIIPGMAAFGQS